MFPIWTVGKNDRNLGVGFRADDVGVELDAVAHWYRDVALNKKVLVRLDSITEAGMLALFGMCDALAPDHLTRLHSDRPSLVCALFVYCTCRVYSSTSLCPAIQDRAGRRVSWHSNSRTLTVYVPSVILKLNVYLQSRIY